jgi:hypothetical protein
MSTWTDVATYIKTQLRPGVLGNTDVQKILNSVLAVINQINAGEMDPQNDSLWDAETNYPSDVVPVLWKDTWLVSNIADNLGNVPISTAGVVHPTWRIIASSVGSGIRIWEAIVYPNVLEIVFRGSHLYYLNRDVVGPSPFVSSNFATELAANQWVALSGGEQSVNAARFIRGGTWIWKGVGFQFETVDTEYYLPGVTDPIFVPATDIDLAEFTDEGELDNSTAPQFVAPQWDISGNVVPIFGAASSDPIQPAVEFPDTQIAGTPLLLNAGDSSLDPGTIQTQVLFAEGSVGEATLVRTGAGTANYADTVNPIADTISANISNPQLNSSTEANLVADFDAAAFPVMAIKIQLKAAMHAGHNLGIFFRNASNAIITNTVMIALDKNSLDVQTIGIPISSFRFTSTVVRKVVLRWYRAAPAPETHAGFRFDNWLFQTIEPPVTGNKISLVGEVVGQGSMGENIPTRVTENEISSRPTATELLGSEELKIRKPDGSLWKTTLAAIASLPTGSGRRLIEAQVIIHSPTTGTVSARWYSAAEELLVLENFSLIFPGATETGTFRWSLIELHDDGIAVVNSGDENTSAQRPAQTPDTLIAGELIWNEEGEAVVVDPGGSYDNNRYATAPMINSTGLYAKIWESALSAGESYGLELSYHEPTAGASLEGTGQGNLKLSWTCDADRDIVPGTLRFFTARESIAGEFALVQLDGKLAALYHRSSHSGSRIQFRILSQNNALLLSDFINNAPYAELHEGTDYHSEAQNVASVVKEEIVFDYTGGAAEFALEDTPAIEPVVILNSVVLEKSGNWSLVSNTVVISTPIPNPSKVVVLLFKNITVPGALEKYYFAGTDFVKSSLNVLSSKKGLTITDASEGIVLDFSRPRLYGQHDNVLTSAISVSFAGAVPGVSIQLFYQGADLDDLDSDKFFLEIGSTAYDSTKINLITFTFYAAHFISYRIAKFNP